MSVSVNIYCPVCRNRCSIDFKTDLFDSNKTIIPIKVAKFKNCGHDFIIYLDRNFTVRDSYTTDYTIKIPYLEPLKEDIKKVDHSNFDIDIIKINLTPSMIAIIIKTIFLGEKALIVSNESFLNIHYINFFKELTKDSFRMDLLFLSTKVYKEQEKSHKKTLIISGNSLLKNPGNIINVKKLKIEQAIVQTLYNENNPETGFILFKNEIHKAFLMAEIILKYVLDHKPSDINTVNLSEELNKQLNLNMAIDSRYMIFLMDIVNNYYRDKLPHKIKLITKFAEFI